MNKELLAEKIMETEDIVFSFLPEKADYMERITEAVNYSVRAGGKRIRPLLMSETFKAFGGTDFGTLHAFMAAIEFIHNYSLVHDDLPAMDNDMYRRGKLTTHAVYGEDFGVLAGDALLNLAYETMTEAMENLEGERLKNAVKAQAVIGRKAGIYGMVGGQCLDVYTGGTGVSLDQLRFIYENKTCALLEASMMAGALLAGAGREDVDKVEKAASYVGMAFQIRDDILDVIGDEKEFGRPVGSDEKNNKDTYASVKGLETAQGDVDEFTKKAERLLEGLDNVFLKELVLYLADRKY